MNFSTFVTHLSLLEKTNSRLEMTKLLSQLYLELGDRERAPASYLMLGGLVPAYQSLEFQLSAKMIIRALTRIESVQKHLKLDEKTGNQQADLFGSENLDENQNAVALVTAYYKKIGDIGETVEQLLAGASGGGGVASMSGSARPPAHDSLSVLAVYQQLITIAKESGDGSQERKIQGLVELFSQLDSASCKYVARIIMGKLRLGFSTMTILDALSQAVVGDKSAHEVLEEAYQKKADVGELARAYLSGKSLDDYSVEVGIPFVPALCQRLNTTKEMIEKMGEAIAEPKYDGLRTQIHFRARAESDVTTVAQSTATTPVITAYTRSLENVTHMYPELAEVARALNCQSCILDAEAIGYDAETFRLQKFQATITRKRKHDIEQVSKGVPIRFCVFDILELNGQSLINLPLIERKAKLRALFDDSPSLYMAPFKIFTDPVELKKYHESMLGDGLEGIVVKKSDSKYVGGRKGWRWVKIKESEGTSGKLSDTLDLVVMGYYFGKGKRNKFGVGAFLTGVRDADETTIKTVAKIGTGLTDDQFRELKDRCATLEIDSQPTDYIVDDALKPDVWMTPKLVVEIAADEVTHSPNHSAKLALRFPRLVKFRDDKTVNEATSLEELQEFV